MPATKSRAETTAWVVYIVRCHDHTLYTGITRDLTRRLLEHNSDTRGARYTRSRRPVTLVYCEAAPSRSMATRRERQIKKLTPSGKRRLLALAGLPSTAGNQQSAEALIP